MGHLGHWVKYAALLAKWCKAVKLILGTPAAMCMLAVNKLQWDSKARLCMVSAKGLEAISFAQTGNRSHCL